jgi:hypothetical protein
MRGRLDKALLCAALLLQGLGARGRGATSLAAVETKIDPNAGVKVSCAPEQRLRILIETDAGGDPDDEQSLVRFLLYADEWDVEGIIANRPVAREKENLNVERTGLGIVQAQLRAYAQCYSHLAQHDSRYPSPEQLWTRTVAGYEDRDEGVNLIRAAIDSPDPRPIWFCNWGTDHGSASSNLKRALDRVLRERGPAAYADAKNRLRLSSADAFGAHTSQIEPPWPIWIDTFRPELSGRRWYHRFSALTETAGGFDLERDVRTGHGPLGALYPTNTTHRQKEGDTMSFLYLVPTGMNDPNHPGWGSWAGRYGRNESFSGPNYYWANQSDTWNGTTNRDNTLSRWAVDLQNDFRARLNWCVKDFSTANHPPRVVVNGSSGNGILRVEVPSEKETSPDTIELSAVGSSDPDRDELHYEWWVYPEAGTYPVRGALLENASSPVMALHVPPDLGDREIHVLLTVRDNGKPPLARYRRVIITGAGSKALTR